MVPLVSLAGLLLFSINTAQPGSSSLASVYFTDVEPCHSWPQRRFSMCVCVYVHWHSMQVAPGRRFLLQYLGLTWAHSLISPAVVGFLFLCLVLMGTSLSAAIPRMSLPKFFSILLSGHSCWPDRYVCFSAERPVSHLAVVRNRKRDTTWAAKRARQACTRPGRRPFFSSRSRLRHGD